MRQPLIMNFVDMALHRRCSSARFSMEHPHTLGRPSRAGVPPAMVGPGYRVHGRLVGQSVGSIKCLTLFRCAGSLGRCTFQAVGSAKCIISV